MNECLHDDSTMDDIPLLLNEAVLPGGREPAGHGQGEGGEGVHGGVVPLHPSPDPRGQVLLVHLGQLAGDQTIHDTCVKYWS